MQHRRTWSRGRWRVTRERCRIADVVPPPPFGESTAIGSVIPFLVKGLDLDERQWSELLEPEWESIVGNQVAAHTRPGRLQGSTLVVFVDNSVWLSELQRFGKRRMVENLKQRYGPDRIRAVRFQLDPD